MSLLPLLYSDWWEGLPHAHSVMDQHFGRDLHLDSYPHRRSVSHCPMTRLPQTSPAANLYIRPWADLLRQGQGGMSTVKADKDQFQVSLDVQQFAPEEINVKVVDRHVIVEGKHEEKQDEHGWVSRQFSRRYMIPEQCNIDNVVSKLSSDGVLTITVPRKEVPKNTNERAIKIEHTGKPAIRESEDVKPKQNEKKENENK